MKICVTKTKKLMLHPIGTPTFKQIKIKIIYIMNSCISHRLLLCKTLAGTKLQKICQRERRATRKGESHWCTTKPLFENKMSEI